MRVAKSSCVVPGADSMADVETSGATLKPGDDERYLSFVFSGSHCTCALMSPVRRADGPRFITLVQEAPRLALRNPDIADASKISLLERERIEADLEHSTALVQRAMRIGKSLGAGNVSADDVSFLVSARDLLNQRAAPATGTSIVFTLLVTNKIHPKVNSSRSEEIGQLVYTSKHLGRSSQLALLLRMSLIVMFLLLSFTLAMSAYVAWGKLLLDTRDALLHDVGGNDAVFAAQVAHGPSGSLGMGDLIATACKADPRTFVIDEACKQRDKLRSKARRGYRAPSKFEIWGSDHSEEEGVAQHVAVAVGVIGNYILPVLSRCPGSDGLHVAALEWTLGRSASDTARPARLPHSSDARNSDWGVYWSVLQ